MDSIYYQIFDILVNQVGLSNGTFSYYFVSIITTLACCFIVMIPFLVVYWIIRSVMK